MNVSLSAIMGWALSYSLDSALTIKALPMAWELRKCPTGLMFYSDQGSYITNSQYQQALQRYRITQSISR